MEDMEQPQEPRYMRDFHRGRYSHFCVNGDYFHGGKKILLNPKHFRDFPHYMDHLTDQLKPKFGAVRKICTPNYGRRVRSLEDLRADGFYVVAGAERFKPYGYAQIDPNPKKGPPPKYDAEPGHNRRYQVSGRYRKIDAHGKIIKCWPNGNDSMGPRTVLLSYRQPFTLDSILDQVSGVLKDEICGPVEKLYLPNGIKVMSLDQILPNAHYVALRRQDHFKRAHYREVSLPNFRTSPRLERKSILAPLSRSTKTSSHSSPEHSYASNNGSENSYTQRSRDRPYRRDKARKEEDQVFHARPVKHKRSSEKTRQVDYDEDQGGVFKAKNANHATKGARPIDDSRQTRTEVPVDKRPAREVEEEDDFSPRYTTQDRRGGGDHHEEETTKGKDDKNKNKKEPETTYRANTKRPTPPGSDQANKEAEKEARARREAEDRERAEKARQQREAMNNKKKDDAEKKKREEDEKKRQEDEDRNNKNKGDAEKKKREEEEKRRQQDEAKNSKNKDDAEKKKREEEEKKRQQDQGKNNKNKDDAEKKKREEEEKRKQQEEQERKKREEEEAKKKKQQPAKGKKTSTPETNKNKARDDNKNNHRSTPTPQASPINHQQDEEELAAARIQAGYRGYKTRKDLKEQQVVGKVDQKGRQAQQMERDADDELEEYHRQLEREEEQAAAKIQAGYRGFKTRQELKAKKADERVYRQDSNYMRNDPIPLHDDDDQWGPGPANDDEEDREHKAAATIQAGFRGYKDRQKVKDMRTQQG